MPGSDDLVSVVISVPDAAAEDLEQLKGYVERHGRVRRTFVLTRSLSAQLPNRHLEALRLKFPQARVEPDEPGELEGV